MNNIKISTVIFSLLIFFHGTVFPLQKTFQKSASKVTCIATPRKPIYKTQKRNMTGAEVLAYILSAKALKAAAVTGTMIAGAWYSGKKTSDAKLPMAQTIANNNAIPAISQEMTAATIAKEIEQKSQLAVSNISPNKSVIHGTLHMESSVSNKFTLGVHAIAQNGNKHFYVTQQEKLMHEAQEALFKAYQDQLYQAATAAQNAAVDPQLKSTVQNLATSLNLESFAEYLGITLQEAKKIQAPLQIEAINKAIASIESIDTSLLRLLIGGQMTISDSPEAKQALGALALKVTAKEWAKIFDRTTFKSFHEHQSYLKKGLHWLGQKIPVNQKYFDDLVSMSKSGPMDDVLYARQELLRVYVPIAGEQYNDVQKHAQSILGITPIQASSSVSAEAQNSIGLEQNEGSQVTAVVETSLPEQSQSISDAFRQNISGAVNKAVTETFSAPSLILTTLLVSAQGTANNSKEFGVELGKQLTKNMATNLTAQGITAGSKIAFIKLGGPAAAGTMKALIIKAGYGGALITLPAWAGPAATFGAGVYIGYISSGLVNSCWNSAANALNTKASQATMQQEAKKVVARAMQQAEEFKAKWLTEQMARQALEEKLQEETSKSLLQRATEAIANNKIKTTISITTATTIAYFAYNGWQKSKNNNLKLPQNYSEVTTGGPRDPKDIKEKIKDALGRVYDPSAKHHKNARGNISPEPLFPQESLKAAIEFSVNGDTYLVSLCKNGELIDIFHSHIPGKWHGYSITPSQLLKNKISSEALKALVEEGLIRSPQNLKFIRESASQWIKKAYGI